MRKISALSACLASLGLLGASAAWADLGAGPGPVKPDLLRPGGGTFPNVKTNPLQTSDTITVPWRIHYTNPQANLAGIRFKVHYDANEVDLLHVGPAGPFQGVTPGGMGLHTNYSVPMPPLPPSVLVTSPPIYDAMNSFKTFTAWIPQPTAGNSGISVTAASKTNSFALFQLHARHTSLFNSDFDFAVSQATTIEHAVGTTSPWTKWVPSAGWVPGQMVLPSEFYLGFPVGGVHASLGIEHDGEESVGPSGGDVIPDPDQPGEGFFPNVKTHPLKTSDTITVPWAVHSTVMRNNVVGYKFVVHYDRNEVDLLHVLPAGVPPFGSISPGGIPHGDYSIPLATLPESELQADPPVRNTTNAGGSFIGWLPPSIANASGTEVPESVPHTFASFVLHARHTSLFNSDFDFRVSEITPILHATPTVPVTGTFNVWSPSLGFTVKLVLNPSSFYLGSPIAGEHAWLGLEHDREIRAPALSTGGLAILVGILMLVPFWMVRRRGARLA
jgi:hypothetical protein